MDELCRQALRGNGRTFPSPMAKHNPEAFQNAISACQSSFTQIGRRRGMGLHKSGFQGAWGICTLAWSGQKHAHPWSFKTSSYDHPSRGRYRELGALPGNRSLATSRHGASQGPASSACKRSLRRLPHLPGPGLPALAPAAVAAAFRCARALSQSRARPPPAAAVRLAPGRGRGTFALLLPARGRRRQRHRGHEL